MKNLRKHASTFSRTAIREGFLLCDACAAGKKRTSFLSYIVDFTNENRYNRFGAEGRSFFRAKKRKNYYYLWRFFDD